MFVGLHTHTPRVTGGAARRMLMPLRGMPAPRCSENKRISLTSDRID